MECRRVCIDVVVVEIEIERGSRLLVACAWCVVNGATSSIIIVNYIYYIFTIITITIFITITIIA